MTGWKEKMHLDNSIKIAQITDFHLCEHNNLLNASDPEDNLKNVMLDIEKRNFDIILCTGDLSEDGSIKSYLKIKKILSGIDIPVFIIPGNHDHYQNMEETLNHKNIIFNRKLSIGTWDIIPLKTCVHGEPYGYVTKADIELVEYEISKNTNNKIIVMHHNPIKTDGFMDQYMIKNDVELIDFLIQNDCIKGVFFGHIHQNLDKKIESILFLGTLSTCFNIKSNTKELSIVKNLYGYREIELLKNGEILNSIRNIN
jgi:Icc protein